MPEAAVSCGLRSLRWAHVVLWALVAVVALALFVTPAHAAGKPLSIALSPSAATVTEGQGAAFTLTKSGGNGRATAVRVTASDGSFSANVMPGSSFTVPTVDDAIVNGTRSKTIIATASTGATAQAALTVLDNDVAPTPAPAPAPSPVWIKCADENGTCTTTGNVRYGFGTTWTASRPVAGSIACDNATWGDPIPGTVKECDSDGAITPAPAPTPAPSGSWVAAPLTVGGYAKALASEQSVPKASSYTYAEAIYRTVQAGEVIKLAARAPGCTCAGQHEWKVFELDGRFIGYLWEANLSGVAAAP